MSTHNTLTRPRSSGQKQLHVALLPAVLAVISGCQGASEPMPAWKAPGADGHTEPVDSSVAGGGGGARDTAGTGGATDGGLGIVEHDLQPIAGDAGISMDSGHKDISDSGSEEGVPQAIDVEDGGIQATDDGGELPVAQDAGVESTDSGHEDSPECWIPDSGVTPNEPDCDGEIVFPDAKLEAVIRRALGQPLGPILGEDLKSITNLSSAGIVGMGEIGSIEGIQCLTKLETLNFAYENVSDLSPLSSLGYLRNLYLSSNAISTVSMISAITNIEDIDLSDNSITDIEPLSVLPNLRHLSASSNELSRLPRCGFVALEELQVSYNQIEDISPAWKYARLVRFSARDNDYVAINANVVSNSLRELVLGWSVRPPPPAVTPSNLAWVATVPQVTKLILDNWPVDSLEGIQAAHNLEYFSCAAPQSNPGDTGSIGTGLVTDLEPLRALGSLRELLIGGYPNVVDISPITGLLGLQTLALWNNDITDLSPIIGMGSLAKLILRSNRRLTDISVTEFLPLDIVHLSNTKVTDFGPLVRNKEVGAGDVVMIPLECVPCSCAGLPELAQKGVELLDPEWTVTDSYCGP